MDHSTSYIEWKSTENNSGPPSLQRGSVLQCSYGISLSVRFLTLFIFRNYPAIRNFIQGKSSLIMDHMKASG